MTTQSNVCVCETCVGTQCTCGCQNPAPAPNHSGIRGAAWYVAHAVIHTAR
jgi:hypothetical protein